MGVLDELFADAEKQRLVDASNQFKTYEGLPTAPAPYLERRGVLDPGQGGAVGQEIIEDTGFTTGSDTELLMANAGVLNKGAPNSVRALISFGQVSDPDSQKKNVLFQLKNYYKEKGLITDDYDFGLRIGPQSNRLEYKDPEEQGKYNVIDKVGVLSDLTGDISDLSGDVPTIASEIAGSILAARFAPGGRSGVGNLSYAATSAFVAELIRLKTARSMGAVSPDVTDDDLFKTAINTTTWSALGGAGGLLLYKIGKPMLSVLGLAPKGLRFDLDEESFLKAYESYKKSPSAKLADETNILPTSAQITKAAIDDPSLNLIEKTQMASLAGKLAKEEADIATAPNLETGAAITEPSFTNQLEAKNILEKQAGRGIDTNKGISENTLLEFGEKVQQEASKTFEASMATLNNNINSKLADLDSSINEIVNLPRGMADGTKIGETVKSAFDSSYEIIAKNFDEGYENLYKEWSAKTGVSLDSIVEGAGAIKPSELAQEVVKLRNTFKDRPFVNKAEKDLIDTIYNSFVTSEKGGAIGVKTISLRTLNENLRDLRRLERSAYVKAKSGVDSPYPETLSKLVKSLEDARARILNRKGAPEDIALKLKELDDNFADFASKYRNAKVSAIAKIRKSDNPEAVFSVLFKPDKKGKTAVLEVANELKNRPENADVVEFIGDRIRKEWLDTVVKRNKDGEITTINQQAHKNFLQNYKTVFDEYLTTEQKRVLNSGSVENFANELIKIQTEKNVAKKAIEKELRLAGGTLDKPEQLFKTIWQPDEITPFNKAFPYIRGNAGLLKTFKALVYKDMFDVAQQRVIQKGNISIPNIELLQPYVRQNRDKLITTFGSQYVKNLETTLAALKPALTDVSPQRAKQENSVLATFARSIVGVFTRPGRILTFINKLSGRQRQDAMIQGLIDPDKLAAMAKASKLSPTHSAAIQTLGRIIFDQKTDFLFFDVDTRAGRNESEFDVPKPSSAREVLNSIEANSR